MVARKTPAYYHFNSNKKSGTLSNRLLQFFDCVDGYGGQSLEKRLEEMVICITGEQDVKP